MKRWKIGYTKAPLVMKTVSLCLYNVRKPFASKMLLKLSTRIPCEYKTRKLLSTSQMAYEIFLQNSNKMITLSSLLTLTSKVEILKVFRNMKYKPLSQKFRGVLINQSLPFLDRQDSQRLVLDVTTNARNLNFFYARAQSLGTGTRHDGRTTADPLHARRSSASHACHAITLSRVSATVRQASAIMNGTRFCLAQSKYKFLFLIAITCR